jgi:hypothetical protein
VIDKYYSFEGKLCSCAAAKIREILSGSEALGDPNVTVHLWFRCRGGRVDRALELYDFFELFGTRLVAYNASEVHSSGVTAYLGAGIRKVSIDGEFIIHGVSAEIDRGLIPLEELRAEVRDALAGNDAHSNGQSLAERKRALDEAETAERSTEEILRRHLRLAPHQWREWLETYVSAKGADAVSFGFAQEIGEMLMPIGAARVIIDPHGGLQCLESH